MAWQEAGAAGGQIVGGAINYFANRESARNQMDFNRDMARESMAFTERMSSTAHQREVADLKLAGLNPILSAGGELQLPPARPVLRRWPLRLTSDLNRSSHPRKLRRRRVKVSKTLRLISRLLTRRLLSLRRQKNSRGGGPRSGSSVCVCRIRKSFPRKKC